MEERERRRRKGPGPEGKEGGTKEGVRAARGGGIFGKKNIKFTWSHLKSQRLRVGLIYHNQSVLVSLGLPHLLEGCFGVFLKLLRHFKSLPASCLLAFLAQGRKLLPQVFPLCMPVRSGLADSVTPTTSQGFQLPKRPLAPALLRLLPAVRVLDFLPPHPLAYLSSDASLVRSLGVTNFSRPPAEHQGCPGAAAGASWRVAELGERWCPRAGPPAAWELRGFVCKGWFPPLSQARI